MSTPSEVDMAEAYDRTVRAIRRLSNVYGYEYVIGVACGGMPEHAEMPREKERRKREERKRRKPRKAQRRVWFRRQLEVT
jgi:hypothetical protein